MNDITAMPTDELKTDLDETMTDIGWCRLAVIQGIETYGDGDSVPWRLAINEKIAVKILTELERRGDES